MDFKGALRQNGVDIGFDGKVYAGNPLTPHPLRRWWADLATADTTQVNILTVGDSLSMGVACASDPDTVSIYLTPKIGPGRWVETMLRRLQSSHGTGQSRPYLPTAFNGTPTGGAGFGGLFWEHVNGGTGATVIKGSGLASGDTTGLYDGLGAWHVDIGGHTGNYIERYEYCDRVVITYATTASGGGTFKVTVDGDQVGSNTGTTGTASWINTFDSGALPLAKHQIRVQPTTTGTIYIAGAKFYNGDYGTGVHVYDAARGGYKMASFGTDHTQWAASVTPVAPSLVIVSLGLNDFTANDSSMATFKTNLNNIFDLVRTNTTNDPSEVIAIPYAQGAAGRPESAWAQYRQAQHEVAQARGAAVVDMYHLFGSVVTASDVNDVSDDQLHLNERGHRAFGTYMADMLLAPAAQQTTSRLILSTVEPRVPLAGKGEIHLTNMARRPVAAVKEPVTSAIQVLGGVPFNKMWCMNQPGTGSGSTVNHSGVGGVDVGGTTGTVTTGGPSDPHPRYTNYATGALSGNDAGGGDVDAIWNRGTGFYGPGGGAFMTIHFGLPTTIANIRLFVGLASGTVASTVAATDPGASHVGFSYSSGSNFLFTYRNGTTLTTANTGLAIAADTIYEAIIYLPPLTGSISWQIRGIVPNKWRDGAAIINLPAVGTNMRRAWAVATTTTLARNLRLYRSYIESGRS